ncbi:hypothetical protein GCM10023205_71260 [Yinghuangia aomiensis]|uniref:Uncharacterized protein n=1 Tax=Yinghuangia aomiensis TaxID=676205 RepID=A0ABP9I851_9ACTN
MRKGELSTLLGDGQETRQNTRENTARVEQAVAAHADAVRAAVDRSREESVRVLTGEITALRADVRAARNSAATAGAVQDLRQDLRELRTLLQQTDPNPAPTAPPTQAEPPDPETQSAHALEGAAPVPPATGTSPTDENVIAAPDPTTEAAPVHDTPATPDPDPAGHNDAEPPAVVGDVLAQLREIVAGNAYEDLRREVAELRDAIAALRIPADATQDPQPPAAGDDAQAASAAAAMKDHEDLLLAAARISSAPVLCHRDTWEFLVAKAGAHQHFRHPPQVTALEDGRVEGELSGRSLIAVLISLWKTKSNRDESGDWALAQGFYQRIADRLTHLATDGKRVRIELDDRDGAADPDTDAA